MSAVKREMVIVGAGPAGVSAALWAKARRIDVLLLESGPSPGGQVNHIHFEPREIAGWLAGDGRALASAYARQLAEAGVPTRYGAEARSLATGPELAVHLADGEQLRAQAVLVASGARRRRLGVPGEREFEDRGVSYSTTRDRERLAGRDAVVVGGGDSACENALMLASLGGRVTLLARGELRARPEFRGRIEREPRIQVAEGTHVLAIAGDDVVRALQVSGPSGERTLPCEAVVIKVGVEPNTEWCRRSLSHDEAGYLQVDAQFATSVAGVWAAGDVVRPRLPCVPVAVGHGALALAAIEGALRGA